MRRIYLDYNATTPVHPEVVDVFVPFLRERFGNPSSIHWAGQAVKGAVEEAREQVAGLVNCRPAEVVFTSCGTEANNMALKGVTSALRGRGDHIITTRMEHPGVVNSCLHLEREGFRVTWLEVDNFGLPDLAALEEAITDRTILISIMFANNETGLIFPVQEIAEIAARHRVLFHCDAVQAAGRVPIDWQETGFSLMSLSGHKLYAPKGVGALIIRTGAKCLPLLHGGSQERNRRAGTENVAGIAAFGKACELARSALAGEGERLTLLRDRLEQGILARVPEVRLNGHPVQRLPNTTNLSFAGVAADSLLLNLDLAGIAASSGSACSSGTLKYSPVLAAMGIDAEVARSSIRFSLGRENSDEEIDYLLELLPDIVERLRRGEG